MSSLVVRPACHERIRQGGTYKRPDEAQAAHKNPCKYCFPDGEIDVSEDSLLIARNADCRKVLHRDETTGELEYQDHGKHGPNLANTLKDPDFGPEDLGLGGDA